MKKSLWLTLCTFVGLLATAQPPTKTNADNKCNTLLWRISGKNMAKPSYLFGTMHMLCADDIQLSDSLKNAIKTSDNVYLELDMDNLFEMMGAMTKMKMLGDSTLADLLSAEDYKKVKAYFSAKSSLLPFSILEKYKPLVAASLVMEQQASSCGHFISMEQLIMEEAKRFGVEIKGLETMAYQMSIFDSIPYRLQAQQLVQMVDSGTNDSGDEIKVLTTAYRKQELEKLETMTSQDKTVSGFTDVLLYNRNRNWVKKLGDLVEGKSLVIAVGAGHLPGEKGVINLLRKAGYKVEPVKNDMIKKVKTHEG